MRRDCRRTAGAQAAFRMTFTASMHSLQRNHLAPCPDLTTDLPVRDNSKKAGAADDVADKCWQDEPTYGACEARLSRQHQQPIEEAIMKDAPRHEANYQPRKLARGQLRRSPVGASNFFVARDRCDGYCLLDCLKQGPDFGHVVAGAGEA